MKSKTAKRWLLAGITVILLAAAGLRFYFTVIQEAEYPENATVLEDVEIIKIHLLDDAVHDYDSLEIMRNEKHESITVGASTKIYDDTGKCISIEDLEVGQHITAYVDSLVIYEPWQQYLTCYKIVVQ